MNIDIQKDPQKSLWHDMMALTISLSLLIGVPLIFFDVMPRIKNFVHRDEIAREVQRAQVVAAFEQQIVALQKESVGKVIDFEIETFYRSGRYDRRQPRVHYVISIPGQENFTWIETLPADSMNRIHQGECQVSHATKDGKQYILKVTFPEVSPISTTFER